MTKSLSSRIIEDRRLKQNPYAHLDELGTYSALPPVIGQPEASAEHIRQSRLLLQNPYAYLDDTGGFSAVLSQSTQPMQLENAFIKDLNPNPKENYSDKEIEQLARNLQAQLWKQRNKIWSHITISNPIQILDPEVALKAIGYQFEISETLGQFNHEGKQVEVAGTINREIKHVRISRQFPPLIRSFTAAHELGHALLHKANGLHRDKPIDGTSLSRNSTEYQADKFASYFLMPQLQVRKIFKQIFLTDQFELTEETAFALGSNLDTLRNMSIRQLANVLASAERFNGNNFISMSNQFHVSIKAMAIRLEELELIK